MLRSDVPNPRHATSEPSEHTFGNIRSEKREFTTLEFIELCEKMDRKLKVMYESKFKQYCSPKKGYQATFNDFLKATENTQDGVGGPVDVKDDKSVVEQLWPTLRLIINSTNMKMLAMMRSFGFSIQDCSPFSVQFDQADDLQSVFISYLPRTFSFDGIEGLHNDNDEEVETPTDAKEAGGSGKIVPDEAVANVIHALLAKDDEAVVVMDNDDNEEVEVVDNEQDLSGPTLDSSQVMQDFASIVTMTRTPTFTAQALVDRIFDASVNVELKKREQASISNKQKAKSLNSRWFQKEDKVKKTAQDGETAIEDSSYLEHDRLVELKTKTSIKTIKIYRVLGIWQKYYNKWYLSKEPRKKWSQPFAVGICKLSLRMVAFDHSFQRYNNVIPGNDNTTYERKEIYQFIDASMVKSLHGKF
jgi:hypothetical protein